MEPVHQATEKMINEATKPEFQLPTSRKEEIVLTIAPPHPYKVVTQK